MLIQEGLDAAYEHKTVKQFLMDLARAAPTKARRALLESLNQLSGRIGHLQSPPTLATPSP